jgi:hypothetical protein
VPPVVLRRPSTGSADRQYLDVFEALSRERNTLDAMGGSTILPIKAIDIMHYCKEILEVSEPEDLEDFVHVVGEMDDGYLAFIARRRESASKSTKE